MARKRDWKAEYAKRIARGERLGRTRQQSRGHIEREHIVRREREREKYGIAIDEASQVRRFWRTWNAAGVKMEPDEDQLVEWVTENGFEAFKKYKTTWTAERRNYLKAMRNGTYASKGLGHLQFITNLAEVPDTPWMYYH